MVAQLNDSRVQRLSVNPAQGVQGVKNVAGNLTKKPVTLGFAMMVMVAFTLDIIGLFVNEFPGVGIVISIIATIIFVPWFYFSGIKFDGKRIGSMGATSILEYIPFVGNMPFITLNVIYSYYSN